MQVILVRCLDGYPDLRRRAKVNTWWPYRLRRSPGPRHDTVERMYRERGKLSPVGKLE